MDSSIIQTFTFIDYVTHSFRFSDLCSVIVIWVLVDGWIHVAGYVPPRAGKALQLQCAVVASVWLNRNVCLCVCRGLLCRHVSFHSLKPASCSSLESLLTSSIVAFLSMHVFNSSWVSIFSTEWLNLLTDHLTSVMNYQHGTNQAWRSRCILHNVT